MSPSELHLTGPSRSHTHIDINPTHNCAAQIKKAVQSALLWVDPEGRLNDVRVEVYGEKGYEPDLWFVPETIYRGGTVIFLSLRSFLLDPMRTLFKPEHRASSYDWKEVEWHVGEKLVEHYRFFEEDPPLVPLIGEDRFFLDILLAGRYSENPAFALRKEALLQEFDRRFSASPIYSEGRILFELLFERDDWDPQKLYNALSHLKWGRSRYPSTEMECAATYLQHPCPCCENLVSFPRQDVHIVRDLRSDLLPLGDLKWLMDTYQACNSCGFAGGMEDFNNGVSEDVYKQIKQGLGPRVRDLSKQGKALQLRMYFAARVSDWNGSTLTSLGSRYQLAGWGASRVRDSQNYSLYLREAVRCYEKAAEGGPSQPIRLMFSYLTAELNRLLKRGNRSKSWILEAQQTIQKESPSHPPFLEAALRYQAEMASSNEPFWFSDFALSQRG